MTTFSLNAVKNGTCTCPQHGARQVSGVTTWDAVRGNMARVKFECGCEVERPLKVTRRKA